MAVSIDSGYESFRQAENRVNYRLTFAKTRHRREFTEDGLHGPIVPDAYTDGVNSGDWDQEPSFLVDGKYEKEPTQSDWLRHFLSVALNDSVHETLEYFQVDGQPYLNPHGKKEMHIYKLVNRLADELADLAEEEIHERETADNQ